MYLGGFGIVHCFFKLVSFSTRPFAASHRGVWVRSVWVAGSIVAAAAAAWSAQELMASSQQVRHPGPRKETRYYEIGGQYALGREVPEGALVACELERGDDTCLTVAVGECARGQPGCGAA